MLYNKAGFLPTVKVAYQSQMQTIAAVDKPL